MKYRNTLTKRILAGLLAGAAACAAAPVLAASGVIPNTQLPQLPAGVTDDKPFIAGSGSITRPSDAQMTIHQNSQNGVIKWDGFNVGANATVNFEGPKDGYNTLNYDASGNMSQIYGTINANNNGNIYIVNAAGVEIGNSAQINVGSLYVSNKNLSDDVLKGVNEQTNITELIQTQAPNTNPDAVLMSLGNINANNVTFDGGRIVIDIERLKTGDGKMAARNIKVNTTDADNVVIGYDAYVAEDNDGDGKSDGYARQDKKISDLATVTENGTEVTDLKGYMWVEDIQQLQDIDTNLGGNYALRNSIDATATQDWNDKKGFKPIGIAIDDAGKASVTQNGDKYGFYGKFDGLDYNIFNLNISREGESHVGLFGVVHDAVVNNVTFVGGSITGGNVVGSLAGAVLGDSSVSNITNSASVTGATDVGGIVGYSGDDVDGSSAKQTGTSGSKFTGLINTGKVTGEKQPNIGAGNNVGGLIGYLYNGSLGGTSYNLGSVTGEGHNVGGLVGHAYASTLGDGTNLIYNRLDVEGAYNVGGIVGAMEGTTVQNAENSGTVTATGYTDGTYSYHTAHWKDGNHDTVQSVSVDIANVGGIAGSASHVEGHESKLENVLNTGGVSSAVAKENGYDYYTAGNVGGIVGSAVDTDITNATNRENDIRGAHNVGGVAGYFSGKGTITNGVNDGGDIMATGARHGENFVKEWVRDGTTGGEEAIIGNMGGIVGYMDGDNVYVTASANRGTVHSLDITGTTVPLVSQAANAGGIVGKIDRSDTKELTNVDKNDYSWAAVSYSYNTGDVRGYMGVGGVAGMMYNGEVAGSYNLGTVQTTRNAESFGTGLYYSVNMGGVVGDTTEGTGASALLYDVYNKGQIGDETFKYYARHVGGIVGRLSGTVEKAYNTGAIYNGYNVVGGIVGWMYTGSITNAFNTGNITVNNKENGDAGIQVGGIAGGATAGAVTISNVYNLGTIRGFQDHGATADNYAVGGIVGAFIGSGNQSISNAYTTGNLYLNVGGTSSTSGLGSIYGYSQHYRPTMTLTNTYYIRPDVDKNGQPLFTDLYDGTNPENDRDNSNKAIAFNEKDDASQYKFGFTTETNGAISRGEDGNVTEDWRIYAGSTPILNAFLPNTEDYFAQNGLVDSNNQGGFTVQYGTAYDPLLTIIKADTANSLTFNWIDLGANNAAGIAVYGAGLTLNDFKATGGSGYYAGLLYADGALSIHAEGDASFGSASELYGSSVAINAKGDVTIYGDITATGNTKDGTESGHTISDEHSGDITIAGGNVDVYGQLTSAKKDGKPVRVPGIHGMAEGWNPAAIKDENGNPIEHAEGRPDIPMSDLGDRFGYTTSGSAVDGDITIIANDASDGHVNVYYGNQEEGFIDAAGNLSITAAGDIYMDSDLKVGGNLTLTSPGEMVLDLTNIGQVQNPEDPIAGLHEFMHYFEQNGAQEGNTISFQTGTSDGTAADAKLTVDMWNDEKNAYDLTKYDTNDHIFKDELDQLNFTVQGDETASAAKYTYIWVSTGEQLAGIQQAADTNSDFLGYNFALKNDIDASGVTDYKAIGGAGEYKGTFDGRDNRIIGLDVSGDNAGIFSTVGTDGKVEDLRVYSGTFSGTDNAGAVAGVNNGTISNVTAFGNVVSAEGSDGSTGFENADGSTVHVGAAGGIAGVNTGTIDNVTVSGTATAADGEDGNTALSAAGGIAGINMGDTAVISNSSSNSAVNASAESTYALGGVAGVNQQGTLDNVDSLGVTTGLYKVEKGDGSYDARYSDNVGGIVGTNGGAISNAYNESIVSGRDDVGGIIGKNTATAQEGQDSPVQNVSNASAVTGESADGSSRHVGGLVGNNQGAITGGRNNGTITGENYVGGLVGENGAGSTLTNLVNDEAASITGNDYVGGIAGSNSGTISATDQALINRGTIIGQQFVGGVAGENKGSITNTNNDVELHIKESTQEAQYFGGVAGVNSGTIKDATNRATIQAQEADYVGGIVGWNKEDGDLIGMGNSNKGLVEGERHVGGVAGRNDAVLDGSKTDEGSIAINNSGVVIAHDGGAGGIFGENNGKLSYVEITNTGIVSGSKATTVDATNGTGGIIGVNTADIDHSSLKNESTGQVSGVQNVGGLIGVNSGTITGGRTEADDTDVGYYKYQIYNNGTIKAGTLTWTDKDGNGQVDEGETSFAAAQANDGSTNIAGLIGVNQKRNDGTGGTLTAGYNTGAVIAGGSQNVGGIAGTNAGTLDQVFNTVMTADGSKGSITGATNVGGLVGANSGTISNAYNTTGVSEGAGTIAGNNTGTIENVYSSVAGDLTNAGSTGTITNGYDITQSVEGKDWKTDEAYGGFDFSADDGDKADWKIYEGSTNPLLKVFLTKVTISGDTDLGLVYNGKNQDIDLDDFTSHSGIFAADDFAAYENNNSLIQNTDFEHKNAGEYDNWLYSGQIAASNGEDGFNPNNLGYDIDFKQDIDKAVIKVEGNTVDRTYGSSNISDNGSYGFIVSGINTGGELTSEMKQELTGGNLGFDSTQVSDGALSTETGRVTNDVSDNYTWSANLSLGDALKGNYVFEAVEGQDGTTTTVTGQSHVNKAGLIINAESDTIYVGGTPQFSGTVISDVLVNGDTIFDGSYQYGTEYPVDTSKPGSLGPVIGIHFGNTYLNDKSPASDWDNVLNGLFKNYNVEFKPGTLTVQDLPEGMPEISDIPSIERHWNFLFDDNPWDRNRDFRERKAEVHFVAGGMTL